MRKTLRSSYLLARCRRSRHIDHEAGYITHLSETLFCLGASKALILGQAQALHI